ncbi:MAG: peptide chain release factor 1 [Flavobacteriales bacterium]|jgi:peptide chain release factor 1|nr:peptide chain release factor 1 [Flavobacteriales bacterium]|tara:strand:+ start:1200 stop:2270 length:1071 start_codon:yes stop_codon:yes gene_type:complete
MLDKLEAIKNRFDEVSELIVDPNIISDMKQYIQLNKEYKDLQPIIEAYHEYKNILSNIENAKEMLKDDEMKEMAKIELDDLMPKQEVLEEEIKVLLIPKDPADSKNAVVEIRAGAGGDEASIFTGDLYRLYSNYASSKSWKTEVVDVAEGTSGGYKEIIFNVKGEDVYGMLKFESGVHRVQRVPQTETQGRVHTSAASVVVMPEAEEFDVEIKDSDIRKDTYCSSGPGGQSVNTTYSAVRLTHIPTGVVAQCQDQKSQHKNYDKALKVLRSRIYEIEMQKRLEELSGQRKSMVVTGDRSAKIRTYNYPQGRVTDHRIGLTQYNLSNVMDGEIDKFIEELQLAENAERLKEGTTNDN